MGNGCERVPQSHPDSLDERRAFHRELRSVARILRLTGLAFALLGTVGLLLGYRAGAWWMAPSWFLLLVGAVLIAAGAIRRVRHARKPPSER